MSFEGYELTVADGEPAYLFQIYYTGVTYYLTSADTDFTIAGTTYSALPITVGDIPGIVDTDNSNVEIKMPGDSDIPELFRAGIPSEQVSVTIYMHHVIDTTNTLIVVWKGRLTNCEWDETENSATFTTESVFTSMARSGLVPRVMKQCPACQYDARCGLSKAAWRDTAVATMVSGVTVTVAALVGKDDDYYAGGFIEWDNPVTLNTERRFIKNSASATGLLTLSTIPTSLESGLALLVYPGCDHTLTTCDSKFGNSANYRGCPYIPTRSIFGGATNY